MKKNGSPNIFYGIQMIKERREQLVAVVTLIELFCPILNDNPDKNERRMGA